MKILLSALTVLALAPRAFAQQQSDLAADFAALESRIMTAQSEIMARQAEVRRLTKPLPKGPKAPHCDLKDREPGSPAALLRQALSDVAYHIVAANQLDIPVFCGVVVNPQGQFNAGSVVQNIPIQDDDETEAQAASYAFKYIAVNRGVLDKVQDDSELAAVLGHELAHLVLGHARAGMMRGMAAEDIAEDWQGSPFLRPDVDALNRWYMGYAQSYELEADRLGSVYAARAGYDPLAFDRLFALVPEPPRVKGEVYDHPSNQERAAAFQSAQAEARATTAQVKPVLRLSRIRQLLQQLP